MTRWNQIMGLATLSFGLIAMSPNMTEAADCYACDPVCNPCDPCADSCLGGMDFGIDFLFWKPAIDDLDFCASFYQEPSAETTWDPQGTDAYIKYHGICPGWEPGFRLRLAKEDCWCDWKLNLSYTRLQSTQKRHCDNCDECHVIDESTTRVIVGPPLFGGDRLGTNPFQFAEGKWESTYQTWDVLFSFDIDCCHCHTLTPFFGVEGLILNQRLEVNYENTPDAKAWSAQYKWADNFFGAGIKVGTEYTYNICQCLQLFARASGSLIVGDDDITNTQTFWTGTTSPDYLSIHWKDDDCVRILPGYHVQLGLLYESCYCGTEWGFRFGWELVEWHNIANHRSFVSEVNVLSPGAFEGNSVDVSGSSSPNTRTYGFHGLLAGLEVHF